MSLLLHSLQHRVFRVSFAVVSNSFNSMGCPPPGSSVHGILCCKNTGEGCHALLQGILLTQGLNPRLLCLLHWQAGSLPLAPPGKAMLTSKKCFLHFRCGSGGSRLQCGRPGFDPQVGKIPWRRERLPTPVFWPGEFHGHYNRGRKESDTTERLALHFTSVTTQLTPFIYFILLPTPSPLVTTTVFFVSMCVSVWFIHLFCVLFCLCYIFVYE